MRDFPFLEPPNRTAMNETLESLTSQGIVDPKTEKALTPLGIILAKLPVDVAISKARFFAYVMSNGGTLKTNICLDVNLFVRIGPT